MSAAGRVKPAAATRLADSGGGVCPDRNPLDALSYKSEHVGLLNQSDAATPSARITRVDAQTHATPMSLKGETL